MDQKTSRIRRSEPLTNRTSSKVKFGKGKGGFPMPSFLSPSPLTSLSHLWRVLVKGESGSKDTLRCSMGWRMWSFHKTFNATRSYGWRQPYRSFLLPLAAVLCLLPTFHQRRSHRQYAAKSSPAFRQTKQRTVRALASLHPHSGIVLEYSLARLEPDFRLDRSADFVSFIVQERRETTL